MRRMSFLVRGKYALSRRKTIRISSTIKTARYIYIYIYLLHCFTACKCSSTVDYWTNNHPLSMRQFNLRGCPWIVWTSMVLLVAFRGLCVWVIGFQDASLPSVVGGRWSLVACGARIGCSSKQSRVRLRVHESARCSNATGRCNSADSIGFNTL